MNFFKLILSALIIAVTLQSCTKDEPLTLNETNISDNVRLLNDAKIPFAKSEYTVEQIVSNREDKEDEAINKKLYTLTKYLADGVLTLDMSKTITTQSKQKGMVSFESIFNKHSKIENGLLERADFGSKNNPYMHRGIEYYSYLTVPNFRNIKSYDQFVLAVGNDVEDDEETGNSDVVHGWLIDKKGILTTVKVGEKDAMDSEIPIIVVTQQTDESSVKEIDLSDFGGGKTNTAGQSNKTGGQQYVIDQLQINHRYDNTKNSEVYIRTHRIDENGTPYWLPLVTNSGGKVRLKKVHKNDIGKVLTMNQPYLNPVQTNVTPTATNAAFFTLWERDWYASIKNGGKACFNNTPLFYDNLKMKYSNEWYSFDPNETDSSCSSGGSDVTIDESKIIFNQTEQIFNFDGNKGKMVIDFK